ncbi:alcohol dehydrogenase [Tamaricihabitans halophyticus]|uniref:Alcohol dehydrogenase n=1 Tax=Tamaricihabitans halophyticus TaxID=1262583 RepID=A0A4R2QKR8_9PSEU|nr:zinc-dependent alcohol dehydrogenase family protein [Tamaricihabitans halophyticus]TCP49927.1 alcohol dehydrogenase [Tamaricihabitans halophyticus]
MTTRSMRAAVLREQGRAVPYADSRPLDVTTVELDAPGEGEVLVKIAAAGLCHSDLSAIAGKRARAVPTVAGHEAAGVVEEVGPGVTKFSPGDHVVLVFVASCGHCGYCVSGRPNLCESSWQARANGTLQSGARRLSEHGAALNHASGISAFAEYAVTSETSLVKISEEISLIDAAVLGCAVVTGFGAVVNSADVPAGATVAVSGLGGVGLSALLGAVVAGASTIVAVDVTPAKLRLARELGATHAFDANDPGLVEAIRDATGGGAHYAFEMAGVPASMSACYAATRRGGEVITAALPDSTATFAVPLAAHASDERVVRGSYMGSCVPARDIPRLVALHLAGRLPIERLRSRTIALDQINEGFDRLRTGEAVREVVTFEEGGK